MKYLFRSYSGIDRDEVTQRAEDAANAIAWGYVRVALRALINDRFVLTVVYEQLEKKG